MHKRFVVVCGLRPCMHKRFVVVYGLISSPCHPGLNEVMVCVR